MNELPRKRIAGNHTVCTPAAQSETVTLISKNNSRRSAKTEYTLVGSSCLENDIFIERITCNPELGDYFLFTYTGAYSQQFIPHFMFVQPAIAECEQGVISVIHNKESYQHFLNYT